MHAMPRWIVGVHEETPETFWVTFDRTLRALRTSKYQVPHGYILVSKHHHIHLFLHISLCNCKADSKKSVSGPPRIGGAPDSVGRPEPWAAVAEQAGRGSVGSDVNSSVVTASHYSGK